MDFHLSITDVKSYRTFLADFRQWGTTGGAGATATVHCKDSDQNVQLFFKLPNWQLTGAKVGNKTSTDVSYNHDLSTAHYTTYIDIKNAFNGRNLLDGKDMTHALSLMVCITSEAARFRLAAAKMILLMTSEIRSINFHELHRYIFRQFGAVVKKLHNIEKPSEMVDGTTHNKWHSISLKQMKNRYPTDHDDEDGFLYRSIDWVIEVSQANAILMQNNAAPLNDHDESLGEHLVT